MAPGAGVKGGRGDIANAIERQYGMFNGIVANMIFFFHCRN